MGTKKEQNIFIAVEFVSIVIGTNKKTKSHLIFFIFSVPLYRYYNGKITDHFYTINFNEIGHGKHGYKLEKVECKVWSYAQPGTVPLYRYWNGRDHFYTTSASEIGTTIPGTTGNHG